MSKKKILFIIGSLRKKSFNSTMAKYVEEIVREKADVEILEYSKLPYMNQDIEFPTPEEVEKVREKVSSVDGIWIFTPEYNYNIPGVLKNLLDWLSRPLKPFAFQEPTAVSGKFVTISGAAGRSAAAGARESLAELLGFVRTEVIGEAGTGVSVPAEAFETNELTLSEENKEALKKQAEEFLSALK